MKRRNFLAGAGLVGSLGLFGAGRRPTESPLSVVVWFSERASAHRGLRTRVEGYLGSALEAVVDDVDLSFGDPPIQLDAEAGTHLVTVEWPRLVLAGAAGSGPVGHTGDVNLLLTDGDPRRTPAGYGMRGIAASTGAELLAEMPPADESPVDVEYGAAAAVTQLLLHECGHALGLEHRHGTVTVDGDAAIASPMIGGYAWASPAVRRREIGSAEDVCGSPYPDVGSKQWRLRLRYSACARRAMRRGLPIGPL